MLTKIRIRKLGTNAVSDQYIVPYMIHSKYRDLAMFIAHTGFANIERSSKDLQAEFLFTSLEIAWRLVDRGFLPVFVMNRQCFKIIPTVDMIRTLRMSNVLLSPFDTTFRPNGHRVSIDSIISLILRRNPTTSACQLHRALQIVLPEFPICRSTISYRKRKFHDGSLVLGIV